MKPYRSSIRWQLMAWQMLLLGTVLVTTLSLDYYLQRKSMFTNIDAELQNELMLLMPSIAPMSGPPGGGPPRRGPPRDGEFDLPPPHHFQPDNQNSDLPEVYEASEILEVSEDGELEKIEEKNFYLISWDQNGEILHSYGEVPAEISFVNYPPTKEGTWFFTSDESRKLTLLQPMGFTIVIGRSLEETHLSLAALRNQLLLIGFSVFFIGHAGGAFIIRRALRPILQISLTAEEISRGDHSQRIELASAPEELTSLAKTLNNSFIHLDNALEAQKRFSADASHELRTPIAVVLAQTQSALNRERKPEEYKLVLEACLRAGLRMKTMADSLLDLTQINMNKLNTSPQSLNKMVEGAVAEASGLSEKHPVDFQGLEKPLELNFDTDRMHQVLMNLMSNAIRHNPDGCPIHVSIKEIKGSVHIEVTDEGQGIPEEALPHLFERFYRVDKSRSRQQGGAGLGLSIVKSLVEIHGGTIKASSCTGKGSTFTIELPLT